MELVDTDALKWRGNLEWQTELVNRKHADPLAFVLP